MAIAQTYNQRISAPDVARQAEYRRNLTMRRVAQQRDQQEQRDAYTQKMGEDLRQSQRPASQSDAQKKQEVRDFQQKIKEVTNDREIYTMSDDLLRIAESEGSMSKMAVNVAKMAVHAREALHDYTSKWWGLAFFLALIKDGLIDPSTIIPPLGMVLKPMVGWPMTLFFFIFLWGGGYIRKRLGQRFYRYAILFLIMSFFPFVNIFMPETVIAVFVRWRISKKEADKAKGVVKNIKEIQEYDE
ncbi:MAG: hypothetical protein WC819_06730 [Parcubacteria group bacterium]|jgi:hypothetical protein